jgi:lipopolysaccharide biosynthesis glycosyltransferase
MTWDDRIFIGYDEREDLAYRICFYSIRSYSAYKYVPERLRTVDITGYNRPVVQEQSTDFTYSRFLVPHLSDFKGFSIFVDCDFLFLSDVQELFELAKSDREKAVWVCKHPQYIPNSVLKMDGKTQYTYPRKNWSSLMVFNNEHPRCAELTLDTINDPDKGKYLHRFDWVTDDAIGSIPLNWNCLDDYYLLDNPKAIHYTDGGPWFPEYQETTYSDIWKEHLREWEYANLIVSL